MHEKLAERNFKCTMRPTFTSPSCHPECCLPPHSLTYLPPPTSMCARHVKADIHVGSVKPMPAGSSWAETQSSATVHRVLSAVHTEIFAISLDCLVAFLKNCVFFPLFKNTRYFLTASETPRIESLTHQILEPHHSPRLWFLIQGVSTENQHSLSRVSRPGC